MLMQHSFVSFNVWICFSCEPAVIFRLPASTPWLVCEYIILPLHVRENTLLEHDHREAVGGLS